MGAPAPAKLNDLSFLRKWLEEFGYEVTARKMHGHVTLVVSKNGSLIHASIRDKMLVFDDLIPELHLEIRAHLLTTVEGLEESWKYRFDLEEIL